MAKKTTAFSISQENIDWVKSKAEFDDRSNSNYMEMVLTKLRNKEKRDPELFRKLLDLK